MLRVWLKYRQSEKYDKPITKQLYIDFNTLKCLLYSKSKTEDKLNKEKLSAFYKTSQNITIQVFIWILFIFPISGHLELNKHFNNYANSWRINKFQNTRDNFSTHDKDIAKSVRHTLSNIFIIIRDKDIKYMHTIQ